MHVSESALGNILSPLAIRETIRMHTPPLSPPNTMRSASELSREENEGCPCKKGRMTLASLKNRELLVKLAESRTVMPKSSL